ncbi:MAG: UDP-N-acetylglucosamine 1-carboxyvinyltransferase, partial [Casimicrobium sp.]
MTTEKWIEIQGGRKLSGGRVSIAGSSNQVTKCVIAALLTEEPVLIKGAPDVDERKVVEKLFASIGGKVETIDEHTVRLTAKTVDRFEVPAEICRRNRISILAAGPLLHRFRRARLYAALGGDKIGKRPVDFHIKGLEEMGAHVELVDGCYEMSVDENGLHGAHLV